MKDTRINLLSETAQESYYVGISNVEINDRNVSITLFCEIFNLYSRYHSRARKKLFSRGYFRFPVFQKAKTETAMPSVNRVKPENVRPLL